MKIIIHNEISNRLKNFHKVGKIPNIIFHGRYSTGKKQLLYDFIDIIYNNDKQLIQKYVINVNCAHGKGIKFIREDLKFFAKTNTDLLKGSLFKTIILQNADKLTIDAQSALRRCIELYNHTTRFFIVLENVNLLMKPIQSRFCEIYVPLPIINKREKTIHQYINNTLYPKETKKYNTQMENLSKMFLSDIKDIPSLSTKIYEKGFSGLDVTYIIKKTSHEKLNITMKQKYELLIKLSNARKEFRFEKLYIMYILHSLQFKNSI
jgi:DNA polymerase III delta prime subunit